MFGGFGVGSVEILVWSVEILAGSVEIPLFSLL